MTSTLQPATLTSTPSPVAMATLPTPTTTATSPRVELLNFQFTPEVLVVQSGQTVQLELITEGLPHTFTIRDLGIDITVP